MTQTDDRLADLGALLAEIDRLSQSDDGELEDFAPVIVRQVLRAAAKLCGPRVLAEAYGKEPEANDRPANLEALSTRLWTLFHFFSSCENPASLGSVVRAADEAYKVANGDQPLIFAPINPKQGRRANAFALSLLQLRAVEWDYNLAAGGVSAEDRRKSIAECYGTTWDAIVKWKKSLARSLGSDIVETKLAVAKRLGEHGLSLTDGMPVRDAVQRDGRLYLDHLGYRRVAR